MVHTKKGVLFKKVNRTAYGITDASQAEIELPGTHVYALRHGEDLALQAAFTMHCGKPAPRSVACVTFGQRGRVCKELTFADALNLFGADSALGQIGCRASTAGHQRAIDEARDGVENNKMATGTELLPLNRQAGSRPSSGALRRLAGLALALTISTGLAQAASLCDGIQCNTGDGTCTVTDSGLPLRLLVRPDANLHEAADETSAVVQGNLASFSVMYALEAMNCDQDTDDPFNSPVWYKVGFSAREAAGYMSANRTVQWRNAMSLAYTNPGASERRRVLMFDQWDAIDRFIEGATKGEIDVGKTYDGVLAGKDIPPGVRAIEPERWVDVDRRVYLLPVLQSEDLSQYYPEDDFRALQIAALSKKPASGASGPCDLQSDDAEDCVRAQGGGEVDAIDIVWVIDMTLSMQPYIDAVAEAIFNASIAMREQIGADEKIRFGLVGFRDDVEGAPWLEFVTRNFTPELLSTSEFEALMKEGRIKAADKSTGDFPEEVFPGVREGARSAWREKSAKVMILIGDASSHPLGHPKNTENLSEEAVKTILNEQNIYLAAVLLANPASAADSELADKQFRALSELDGGSAFHRMQVSAAGAGGEDLAKTLKQVAVDIIDFASSNDMSRLSGQDKDEAGAAIKKAIRAAAVDYLGQEADPPADITAWVADRDIGSLDKQAFEVRVVVTRKDVLELKQLLTAVLAAVRAGTKSDSGFIEDTTRGSAAVAMDLALQDDQKFKESGLVPRWINSLPYRSPALSYSIEEFLQQPADDRTKFEERIASLINAYEQVLSNTDTWHALNDKDVEEGQVHLLPLKLLP